MIKSFIKNSRLFLSDHLSLYLFFALTIALQVWVALLHPNGQAILSDLLIPECYLIAIITCLLAYRWQKKRRSALRLLNESELESVRAEVANSSQEKLLTELLQKVLHEKRALSDQQQEENQQLKDYYALWAHQIKVPLSVLDLMNQTGTVDQRQTKEQLFLVNQYLDMLLSFIRLQDISSDLVFKSQSAKELVLRVVKEYKVFFIEKDLSLSLGDSDFDLVTDSKWLTFVLEQVIYNAIKYTKVGGLTINCTTDQKIIIQDRGIGIDKADLPQIFNQGYTGFNGRVEDNASGLGLYLVKEILDKLGHSIQIDSEIGQGTTVTIDCRQKTLR